ncbi:serpin-like protein [Striga asiatica]|uniref:Serpin-like protein n=1 Tax=Striga asiatica TaxID=4170 RepID=A0A5A7R7K5_STRAF|nr:serpin-like protein [Striga asiatica]
MIDQSIYKPHYNQSSSVRINGQQRILNAKKYFSSVNRSVNQTSDLGRQSIAAQTDFSSLLTKQLISSHVKDNNFVFSPLSIHVVLAMVAVGSGRPARKQLLRYLMFDSIEDLNSLSSQIATCLLADGGPLGGPLLSIANGVWVERSLVLKPDFKEIIKNAYRTHAVLCCAHPVMCSKDQFALAFDDFKVLKLLYQKGKDTRAFSMYFFLPNAREIRLDFWVHRAPHTTSKSENGVLWSPQACVEVEEQGTEAAAVSDSMLEATCSRYRPVDLFDFVADHPFLFVIREETNGVVLFVGQVVNPLLSV